MKNFLTSIVTLVVVFLAPSDALAAIVFDNSCSGSVASLAPSGTCSITIGSGGNVCVMVGIQDPTVTRVVSGVTVGAVTGTAVEATFVFQTTIAVDFYRACGVSSGAQTVTVTMNNSLTGGAGFDATSYTGVDTTSPIDSHSNGSVNSTSPFNLPTIVIASNSWLVMATNWNVLPAAGTGTISRTASLINFDSNGAVGTGSQQLQLTWSGSGKVGGIIASLKPASAVVTPSSFGYFNIFWW